MPDTTGLDLKEQERRWAFIRAGRAEDYHGVAVHPKHLSLWERMYGIGKAYDADLDYKQRVEEMREEWELMMQRKYDEKAGHHHDDDAFDEGEYHSHASTYFSRTTYSKHLKEEAQPDGATHGNGSSDGTEINEKI
jgi:hypothetical protein